MVENVDNSKNQCNSHGRFAGGVDESESEQVRVKEGVETEELCTIVPPQYNLHLEYIFQESVAKPDYNRQETGQVNINLSPSSVFTQHMLTREISTILK